MSRHQERYGYATYSPDDIIVREGRRPLNEDTVKALMESIRAIGLQTHLAVILKDEAPVLVAGAHRLEACRRLADGYVSDGGPVPDWVTVPCNVFSDPLDAELWEISENLHRAELTVTERAENIDRWVRLTESRVKAQVAPSQKHTGGRPNQGINAAVRDLGIDRTEAQRAVKIASIAPAAKQAAREAGLDDNQSVLLRVAREPTAAEQVRAVAEEAAVREARKRTVIIAPEPTNGLEAAEKQVAALMRAWNAAGPEAREEFMRRIDKPVFDRTRAA